MKKCFLFICLMLFGLTGCIGTKDYYNAQTAYYNAQAQASQAHMQAMANQKPLAEMIAPDGTKFTVNQTMNITAPIIRVPDNPYVTGLKTIVNSTPLAIVAGGWSAKQLLETATGDINASGGSTVTSTRNSNNATDLRNADGNISDDTSNNSDNSITDSHDQTADPLVVNQPKYNDPIIVEPPPYNDPIIVNPVVVQPIQE